MIRISKARPCTLIYFEKFQSFREVTVVRVGWGGGELGIEEMLAEDVNDRNILKSWCLIGDFH